MAFWTDAAMRISWRTIGWLLFKNPRLIVSTVPVFDPNQSRQLQASLAQARTKLDSQPGGELKDAFVAALDVGHRLLEKTISFDTSHISRGAVKSHFAAADFSDLSQKTEKAFQDLIVKAFSNFQIEYAIYIDSLPEGDPKKAWAAYFEDIKSKAHAELMKFIEPSPSMSITARWKWRMDQLTNPDSPLYPLRSYLLAAISEEPGLLKNLAVVTAAIAQVFDQDMIRELLDTPLDVVPPEAPGETVPQQGWLAWAASYLPGWGGQTTVSPTQIRLQRIFDKIKPFLSENLRGRLDASQFSEVEQKQLLEEILAAINTARNARAELRGLSQFVETLSQDHHVSPDKAAVDVFYASRDKLGDGTKNGIQTAVRQLEEVDDEFIAMMLSPGVKCLSEYVDEHQRLLSLSDTLSPESYQKQKEQLEKKITDLANALGKMAKSPILLLLQENPNQVLCGALQGQYYKDFRHYLSIIPEASDRIFKHIGVDPAVFDLLADSRPSTPAQEDLTAPEEQVQVESKKLRRFKSSVQRKLNRFFKNITSIPSSFQKLGQYTKLIFDVMRSRKAPIFNAEALDRMIEQVESAQRNLGEGAAPFEKMVQEGLSFLKGTLMVCQNLTQSDAIGIYRSDNPLDALLSRHIRDAHDTTLLQLLTPFVDALHFWLVRELSTFLNHEESSKLMQILFAKREQAPIACLQQVSQYFTKGEPGPAPQITLMLQHILKEKEGKAFFQLLELFSNLGNQLVPTEEKGLLSWSILSKNMRRNVATLQHQSIKEVKEAIKATGVSLKTLSYATRALQSVAAVLNPHHQRTHGDPTMQSLRKRIKKLNKTIEEPPTEIDVKMQALVQAAENFFEWSLQPSVTDDEKSFANQLFSPLLQLVLNLRNQLKGLTEQESEQLNQYLNYLLDGLILAFKNPIILKMHENPLKVLQAVLNPNVDYRDVLNAMPNGTDQLLSLFIDPSLLSVVKPLVVYPDPEVFFDAVEEQQKESEDDLFMQSFIHVDLPKDAPSLSDASPLRPSRKGFFGWVAGLFQSAFHWVKNLVSRWTGSHAGASEDRQPLMPEVSKRTPPDDIEESLASEERGPVPPVTFRDTNSGSPEHPNSKPTHSPTPTQSKNHP